MENTSSDHDQFLPQVRWKNYWEWICSNSVTLRQRQRKSEQNITNSKIRTKENSIRNEIKPNILKRPRAWNNLLLHSIQLLRWGQDLIEYFWWMRRNQISSKKFINNCPCLEEQFRIILLWVQKCGLLAQLRCHPSCTRNKRKFSQRN